MTSPIQGTRLQPRHYVTDHLGSTRAIVSEGQVLERRDYYPFGKAWENPNVAITDNRYLFNGKESQAHVGVNYLDYGARMYDPELGRWMTQDPLAEMYANTTPYAFSGNNPIRYIDLDGKKWVDANGNLMWKDGKWTEYATKDAMRVGIAMMATETGREEFHRIANQTGEINLVVSPDVKSRIEKGERIVTRGDFEVRDYGIWSDGRYELTKGTMTIYEGSIRAEIDGTIPLKGETADLIKKLPSDVAVEASIGAVAVHEGRHGISENVKQQHENQYKGGRYDLEIDPEAMQNQYLKEILLKFEKELE